MDEAYLKKKLKEAIAKKFRKKKTDPNTSGDQSPNNTSLISANNSLDTSALLNEEP